VRFEVFHLDLRKARHQSEAFSQLRISSLSALREPKKQEDHQKISADDGGISQSWKIYAVSFGVDAGASETRDRRAIPKAVDEIFWKSGQAEVFRGAFRRWNLRFRGDNQRIS
jgi:hypothetical protein